VSACAHAPAAAGDGDPALRALLAHRDSPAPATEPRPEPAPAAPAPLGDAAACEPALREALAVGVDPVSAALALVDALTAREDFEGALAVVEAAQARAPESAELTVVRARALYDLARPREAADLLRPLAARADCHPRVLYELALAERSGLRLEAAAAQIELLRGRLGADPWVRERATELATLAAELQAERAAGRRRFVDVRELLAVLRASGSTAARLRVFETLAGSDGRPRQAALRIAAADSEPVVRIAALRQRCADPDGAGEVIRTALEDADPAVRGAAAGLARELPRTEAVPLLMDRLEQETDDYALGRLHEALCAVAGEALDPPPAAAADRAERLRAMWRSRWVR
jgi:hypothetical protein